MTGLSKFSYRELLAQREALETQIAERSKVERQAVIREIIEKMEDFGIKPDDLRVHRGPRQPSGPIAPKYRDLETGATWSGRGIAPRWMRDQDRAKFLISPMMQKRP
jgi:DNA-binding protein H-NS